MDIARIPSLVAAQRAFFATHATRPLAFRREALDRLERAILAFEQRLYDALRADLGKPAFESYGTELGLVLADLRFHRRNLRRWTKPERVRTSLVNLPASSRVLREPYGTSLIVSPWNYPFQLLVGPLVGALSAGNTAVLKAAEHAPHTAAVMAEMIRAAFPEEHVALVHGGRETNEALLEERWDRIFFTGSPALGRIVMEKAAKHLTPVVLELGGKSPCIVDVDADVEVAAKRIAWGKFINAGQTCVAPDYLLVHRSVKDRLVEALKAALRGMYGEDPRKSPDYARIVHGDHLARLKGLMATGTVLAGGESDEAERYLAPTLMEADPESAVMQEEIFGPLLPILAFGRLDEAIDFVNARPKPLALYVFSASRERQLRVLERTSSGGACVNETVMHLGNHHLPFGGVGTSGMGAYHGRESFEAFSHRRAVLDKPTWIDIPIRYAPYGRKLGLVKWILR